jgi:transposase
VPRPRFELIVPESDLKRLKALKAKAPPRERKRLEAVITAAQSRHDYRTLARVLSVSPGTLRTWLSNYRDGGVKELLRRQKPPGPKARVSDASVRRQLVEEVCEGKLCSAGQVSHWLKRKRIHLSVKRVYPLLNQLGLRFQKGAIDSSSGDYGSVGPKRAGSTRLPKRGRPRLRISVSAVTAKHLREMLAYYKNAYLTKRMATPPLSSDDYTFWREGETYDRLKAVNLVVLENKSIVETAAAINRHEATVHRWVTWFRDAGATEHAVAILIERQPGRAIRQSR